MYNNKRLDKIKEPCDALSAPLRKRDCSKYGEDLFTYISDIRL